MLTFGTTYLASDNPYSEDDPDHALILTEAGALLSGTVDGVERLESSLEDSRSVVSMNSRLDLLAAKVNKVREEYVQAPLPLVVLNLDDGLDDGEVVQEFITQMNLGRGAEARSNDFLDLLSLDAEIGGDDDVLATEMTSMPAVVRNVDSTYHPRMIGDLEDVDVLRRARRIGMSVILEGPPGTGKTALCSAAFGDELLTVSANDTMPLADLVGQWVPVPNNPGEFVWRDGPLVTAMLEGRPILIDDASWASNTLQSALLPATDHRRAITVMDRDGDTDVAAADGFVVIFTENPGVGVGIIDPLRDRVGLTIQVPSDLATAYRLGADPNLMRVAEKLAEDTRQRLAQGAPGWVPSIRTLLEATRVQETFGDSFAASAFLADCPIAQEDYREMVRGMLSAQFNLNVADGLVSQAVLR